MSCRRAVVAAAVSVAVCGERLAVRPRAAATARRRSAAALLFAAGSARGTTAQQEELEPAVRPHVMTHFRQLDASGDGEIDRDEFLFAMRYELKAAYGEATESGVDKYRRLFEFSDIDGDGMISHREFEFMHFVDEQVALDNVYALNTGVASKAEDVEDEEFFGTTPYRHALEKHDEDGSGAIDKEEFLKAMRHTAANAWRIGEFIDGAEFAGWLDRVFAHADIKGDGVLGAKEVHFTARIGQESHRSGLVKDLAIASAILREVDADKNGMIGADEIEAASARVAQAAGASEHTVSESGGGSGDFDQDYLAFVVGVLRDRWRDYDADGDQRLDKAELARLSKSVGEL